MSLYMFGGCVSVKVAKHFKPLTPDEPTVPADDTGECESGDEETESEEDGDDGDDSDETCDPEGDDNGCWSPRPEW